MLDLTGKVAIVTGGASGIGEACVRLLIELGARVAVADIATERAEAVANGLGRDAVAVTGDVGDPDAAKAMVADAVAAFGHLDIAVNAAGVGPPEHASIGGTSLLEWRRLLSTNLDGVFYSMQAEIAAMTTNGGSIVNISSVLGSVGAPGASGYVAAKHGLEGLTRVAALDHTADGIRINTVAPGFIATPLILARGEDYVRRVAAAHPMRRLGTAAEVAHVVAFVASPAASFMTGTCVAVDGGYLAR